MTQSEKNQPQTQSSTQGRGGEQSRAIRRDEPRTSRALGSSGVWSPFAGIRRMMDEMDRLFGMSPFGSSILSPFSGGTTNWVPAVEVIQRDNKLEVRADLPGMTPDDVNVEVRDDTLVISGTRQEKHETNEGGVVHCERSYGSFQRTIPLPSSVDPSQVEARFEDGVLEVTLPMPAQQARGRSIEVKRGGRRDGGPGAMRS